MPPTCTILSVDGDGEELKIRIAVSPAPADGRVQFMAAQPAERRTSFTGSCLPLPDERSALQGTANRGWARSVAGSDREFEIVLPLGFPGVYYTGLGSKIAPPMLHVLFRSKGMQRIHWCRAPIAATHPRVSHRSSLNYLDGPDTRRHLDPAAQDTLLYRTRYV